MKKAVIVWARLSSFVLGVALLALATLIVVWHLKLYGPLSGYVDVDPILDVMEQPWWPIAIGATGIVLGAWGIVWLFAHRGRSVNSSLSLTGSDDTGRLRADLTTVADAAAAELVSAGGVRSANGSVIVDQGNRIIELSIEAEPDVFLNRIVDSSASVYDQLSQVLGEDAPATRVVVDVADTHQRTARRVR